MADNKTGAPIKEISFSNVYEDQVPVLDHDNNTVINIPKSDLDTVLRTGKYTLPKGIQVPVVDDGGQGGYLPSEQVFEALQQGMRIEDPQQTKARELQEQYGDKEAAAAAAGAARGLSFGLSDVALTQSGVAKPETLRGLEEANPIASTAGEVAGVAGGLLVPVGAVGVGVKAAATAGKLAERQALKSLAKLGLEKSVAKSIAAKVAPAIASGAVEGALYGSGQLISEDALGKADFNAENLISNMGMGAVFGGSLGGTLGAMALGGKVAKNGTASAGRSVKNFVSDLTNEVKAAQELTGMTKKEIMVMNKNRPTVARELPKYLRDDLKLNVTDTIDDIAKKVDDKLEAAGATINKVEMQLAEVGEKFDNVLPKGPEVLNKILDRVNKEVVSHIDDTVSGPAPKAQIMGFIERFTAELTPKERYTTAEMYQKMRALDTELKNFYKNPEGRPELQQAMYQVRRVFREEIDAAAEKMALKPGINPEIAKELKKANRDFYYSSQIANALDRKLAAKSGVGLNEYLLLDLATSSSQGAVAGLAAKFVGSDLRRKAVILSSIEKANLKTSKAIAEGVKGFFSSAKRPIPTVLRFEINKSFLGRDENGRPAKDDKTAYKNISRRLNEAVQNPDAYLESINKKTAGLYEVAPETTAALDMQNLKGAQFLASKLPPQYENQGIFNFTEPRQPSDSEMAKFMRYVETVEKPETAIQAFKEGALSTEQAETLKVVYPNVYQRLFESVTEYLNENSSKIPYNKKLQLGMIMDLPVDKSMLPENILGLQQAVKSQQQNINPTVSGLKEMDKANRTSLDYRKE